MVTIETQEDSTIIKTYPTTTKPSKQATKVDVRDCSRENCVCTQLVEVQHAYVHYYQAKTHVYVSKHSQAKGKAKKHRPRVNRGCQEIIRKETQYEREKSK